MDKEKKPADGTGKKDTDGGSSAFNQGSQQDPNYDQGVRVSDEEKRTGHSPSPGKPVEKPKEGNNGEGNAGGTE